MKLDLLKIASVGVLALSLAGCATTRKKPDTKAEESQNRISELEQQLSKKDEEISFLKEELEIMEKRSAGSQESASKEVKTQTRIGTIKQVQRALKNAGFYKGPVDGKMGPSTRKAIREFQKANGLNADGRIGKETWSKLSKHLK